jgi:hypothetical protein
MQIWLIVLSVLCFIGCASDESDEAELKSTVVVQGQALHGQELLAMGSEFEGQALAVVHGREGALGAQCPIETQHRAFFRVRVEGNGMFSLNLESSAFVPVSHPACALSNSREVSIHVLRLNATQGEWRGMGRAEGGDLNKTETGWSTTLSVNFDESRPARSGGEADIQVDATAAAKSWSIQERSFSTDSCAFKERCLTGSGLRRLLTFDGAMMNSGGAPLFIGNPSEHEEADYDSCHVHFHLGSAMTYELVRPNGAMVARGRKQGFCLMDTERASGGSPGVFDCDYQGISPGWTDVYDRSLDCQWIDVTDVPPGDYKLRVTVNPDFSFEEANYGNNQAEIPVKID